MIVNPQLFNYRLITGSLIIAIAALTIFGYSNYTKAKSQEQFLEQEKSLIASELSQLLMQYDEISVHNDLISSQLEEAKILAESSLDSIKVLQGDITVYLRYRSQLSYLRSQYRAIDKSNESLTIANSALLKEREEISSNLNLKIQENSELLEKNSLLTEKIELGSKFYASDLKVTAFKISKGNKIETKNARHASIIDVCLTLTENVLAQSGEKELYVQIVNPKNNVVADKGSVDFGEATLIYSAKNVVFYDNKAKDICVNVKADPSDKPLNKGMYYVNVFHDDRIIGSKKIILD